MGQSEIPRSPCPGVFQYYQKPDGEIYGRVTVPFEGNSNIALGVNASMKGYYTDKQTVKLKLKMITPQEDLLEYRATHLSYSVRFPFQHTIPKITHIELNQNTVCTGPPEELIPGSPGVSNLWAGHKFFFQGVNKPNTVIQKPEAFDPFEDNGLPVTPSKRPPLDNFVDPPAPSLNLFQECGTVKVEIIPLILGGTEISEGTFPWLVAMFVSNGVGYDYKCTANLVSEKHVITAARCVNYFKTQVVQTEDILFVFGRSNLRNWASSGAVTRGASKVQSHPDFDQNSANGDISVLTLDRSVDFSATISAICLWSGTTDVKDIVSKKGTVGSWGSDKSAPKAGQFNIWVAKSLDIPVVSQDDCLSSDFIYYRLTSDTTFCAGQRDGTGTCIGDSGAGFMFYTNGKYYLRGLTSTPLLNDKGECDSGKFMVFCDVAKYVDWIKTAMKG